MNIVVIGHARVTRKKCAKENRKKWKEPIVQIPSPVETELACVLDNSSQEK